MNSARKTIVFDTSTLLGVILKPKKLPYQVFFHALEYYEPVASPETLAELAEVVQRDKFDRFRAREERLQILKLYLDLVTTIEPMIQVADCRDPKDNKFLSLALSANAALLVSSDSDLLVLHPYKNLSIVTVRQYAEQHQLVLD